MTASLFLTSDGAGVAIAVNETLCTIVIISVAYAIMTALSSELYSGFHDSNCIST